jgi:cytochrome c peroxidase
MTRPPARAARWATTFLALPLAACLTGTPLNRADGPIEDYTVIVPLGLDLVAAVPDDNPLSTAKVALGRRLFFDPLLSRDRTMSCATCHDPARYFTNGQPHATGVHGHVGRRNVPSVLNVAYAESLLWDGSIATLEQQVLRPIASPTELDLDLDELLQRLNESRDYRRAFARALGSEPSTDGVAHALASYLRTLRAGDAPIDRFLGGDTTALSAAERRGFRLFTGRANCSACHPAPLFTDRRFYNTGVSWGSPDVGRHAVTGEDADRGAFRVPSLRNVAHTAPYMHDGSLATLADVITHYERGGNANPYLHPEIAPLRLTAAERADLIAFLEALSSELEGTLARAEPE